VVRFSLALVDIKASGYSHPSGTEQRVMAVSEQFPSFGDFFQAVHGYSPFPWQDRLASSVQTQGWPELLNLPTGVGKTTALDIALYCLAAAPSAHSRRILVVVDRRIVVDQGADHARHILQQMTKATDGPLYQIARCLRQIWSAPAGAAPFAIATLRGGMPRDNDWAKRPDQPVVGVSTVDQVGSRLLFRGYGIGRQSAPIHAGLMGRDTLLLLDEVHLAEPFAETVEAIRRFQTKPSGIPAGLVSVRMSATPSQVAADTFELDANDTAHPVLSRRLNAEKSVTLESVRVTGKNEAEKQHKLAEKAAQKAVGLLDDDTKVVAVVFNRVDAARSAFQILSTMKNAPRCVLVTGRMRPLDRDRLVRDTLLPQARAGRDRSIAEPLVVVATQCIEAGADLDFDAMVTEVASLDALRQRFGRVDRRGERGVTESIILCRSDQDRDWDDPIYGNALTNTWVWLSNLADSGKIDIGVTALAAALSDHTDELPTLLPPPVVAPVLLPLHLDSFAQTSPRPKLDQDVELFLHGPRRESRDVQIVWRSDVSLEPAELDSSIERLVARRPVSLAAMTLPIWTVRNWLNKKGSDGDLADTPIRPREEERYSRKTETNSPIGLRWTGDDGTLVAAREIAPGDVIVLPAERGGISAASFDPRATFPVCDLSVAAILRGRRKISLWLDKTLLRQLGFNERWCDACPVLQEDETVVEFRQRVDEWLLEEPGSPDPATAITADDWAAALQALRSKKRRLSIVADTPLLEADVQGSVSAQGELVTEASTEGRVPTAAAKPVPLEDHCERVRKYASTFSKNLGLAPDIAADIEAVATFHDIGKADPRFQRLLAGGSEIDSLIPTQPLAKSALRLSRVQQQRARTLSGYPAGFRHELVSVALLESLNVIPNTTDRDLVLHLVGSHHGWCRPFAPAIADDNPVEFELHHTGTTFQGTTDHGLERLDSGVAERFATLCDRYDWWGLAFLEAVVRLADHRASEEESEG